MSTISGFSTPSTPTPQNGLPDPVVGVSSTTSTTVTIPDFSSFARVGLQQDTSGLTAPKTPEMSSSLIDEILALAEELASIAREDRIRASASAARGALGPLLDLFTGLNAQSETTFNWQTTIDNLTEERGEKASYVAAQAPELKSRLDRVDSLFKSLNDSWNWHNDGYHYWTGKINEYNYLLSLPDKDYSAALKNEITKPGGHMDVAKSYQSADLLARDRVYTTANPTYVDYVNAGRAYNELKAAVDEANGRITQIDQTDMPNAQSSKAFSQALYETQVAFTTLLATALSLLSGVGDSKKSGSDEDLDNMIETALAALADQIAELRQLASDIVLDWTQPSMKGGSSETGDGAQPMPRVATLLLAFLTALGEVGRALGELADLKNDEQAGLSFTNDRYRLAV